MERGFKFLTLRSRVGRCHFLTVLHRRTSRIAGGRVRQVSSLVKALPWGNR